LSRALVACLNIWRGLLVFSRNITLCFYVNMFGSLEDRDIGEPELIGPVSEWNARELIWKPNQFLDERDIFVAQILVVKDNAELGGFGESRELVKQSIAPVLGRYTFGGRTPNWAAGFEAQRECADLRAARARYLNKASRWEVDGSRAERDGAGDEIISIIL
jgi:hypothetical protein